ncbi:hypothetical protein HWD32_gp67 [Gordonia phage Secretariat]|uniref:Uncharacterized protein n=1 Tax=Gordonia phage Secretariat TaxID=2725616 RepID=A0A6M3SXI2_9CAUD|nr:hypothetical protein HWD32_gp67 [Gordonia phage Secretariat]QJD49642.1 hypothetical protein SEA_SECRETARIAT_67 [Gordonia phage Secretariat]
MTIEYVTECLNDCDEEFHAEEDVFRPEQPNVLQFKQVNQTSQHDKLVHYWVLSDHAGVRIASSCHFYESKDEAMKNCIAIFGKELWAGYHLVRKDAEWNRLLEIAEWIENRAG